MSEETPVYIASACRTPIGSFCGVFQNIPAHELGSVVIKEALARAKIDPDSVSEVIMGQSLIAGQGQNPARLASLRAGIPNFVPAYGINMLCGSGLKSVHLGYQAIKSGESEIVVAGGQESMSMAQHCAMLRTGTKLGSVSFSDTLLTDGLMDPMLKMHMGDTAEFLAQKYKISRRDQDNFAFQSQSKTKQAMEMGYFDKEIVNVPVAGKQINNIDEDEYPKKGTTIDALSMLRPVFSGNGELTVTSGNASGINDGAAVVVMVNGDDLKSLACQPLARVMAFSQTGLEPKEMGLGPIEAVKSVLLKCAWTIGDVDLFEINEAFAVQAVIVAKQLEIPDSKLNVSGGAIALGHPIGCSGTRVLVTLLHNMERLNKKRGIASLCIGGGMGIAIAVERP